ncbi:MAG TPA: hypothetical protein VKU83_11915 [Puia sp.]|nr:hypothetical protein [Puia sp.]
MRRRLLVCLLPFLAACSKTGKTPGAPSFSVSAVLNGTPTTFNAIITVDSVSTPGTVYIVAHSDSANLTPLFEITLAAGHPLKPGTYTSADSTGGNLGLIGYTGWQGGSANQYTLLSDTVNLTTVNKAWFSGSFQGTCEYGVDSILTVSNGQFTVGWAQH